jgi:HTH-type transcriptional regulator / antitoxin HigA
MQIKPIRTEKDHAAALAQIEQLWGAAEGSPEGDLLEVLATLVEAFEQKHFPIDVPDPIEAIRFRLEQQGESTTSLIGVIGSRTRVYEVMRGDRPLSLEMIRRLNQHLQIPAEVLIRRSRKTKRKAAA